MEVKELHEKLTDTLNTVELGVAGRVLYYDKAERAFILALHATSPQKAQEATEKAWGSISGELRAELQAANIGFAGKQI